MRAGEDLSEFTPSSLGDKRLCQFMLSLDADKLAGLLDVK
jgi:hypothetical protein